MPYLVNPSGRVVAVDDVEKYEHWLAQPGFRKASPEEQQEHQKEKYDALLKSKLASQSKEVGIYFSTVSQGGADGYSVASKNIMGELKQLGLEVKTYYEGQKVGILFHNPYSILQMEAPYRIIYTMFESDKIPDNWHDYLEGADLILVPSRWCQMVFKKAGFDTRVVPLGYDDKTFVPMERTPKRESRRDFTFLHYNAFNIRKGFPEVFKAFTEEFEKDEPVKLVLKTTQQRIPLPITKSEYPNIDILMGKVGTKQLLNIIQNADCFVFPSRGEGFGIPPLECMATGMPAIVPNAHGISEYFNAGYMYEVKVKEMCPALYSKYKGMDVGKMVVCDVADLRRQMRYVYEHQKQARLKGEAASMYVKKWTYEATAKAIKAIFDEIITRPIPERKLANILQLDKIS